MTYAIYEGNMERLNKKMTRIQNKCRKYGCEFRYEEVGEEFRTLTDEDGNEYTARFVLVEAEGIAIVNGWQFVASLEYTEKGNIISKAIDDVEVPERYYNNIPVCEHCGNKRVKYAYIVMNTETGEFKEVGRNCLKDFTFGMSAEAVAQYTAAFTELIEGEAPMAGCRPTKYMDTKELLQYAAETIRHYGYVKSEYGDSTRGKVDGFYCADRGWGLSKVIEETRKEMAKIGFNPYSEEATKMVIDALAWLEEQEETNNYMHNLKVACGLEWATFKNLGILVSLFPTYNRNLEVEAKKKAEEEKAKASEHVGEVGQRITINVEDYVCVTGWETQWGYTGIYKITDDNGNIFTWKTSNYIPEGTVEITATVKAHNEFRGTKQTELTRCRCK